MTVKHQLQPEKWVDLHADYLFRYASSRISDDETAKDLVQDTFLSAFKASASFQGKAGERTWLVAILKRKIIDYYRKINSEKGKAEIDMSFYDTGDKKGKWIEEQAPHAWGNAADAALESDELMRVIEWCIAHLPEKYAVVFIKKTIEMMDTESLCKELEITSSNLWVMIHRARVQLQKCVTKNWFDAKV